MNIFFFSGYNPCIQKESEIFMKKTVTFSIILLIAALFAAAIPTDAEAMIYDDTVRLHILANSDSDEDQALKITLRDAILEKYSAALLRAQSTEDAERIIGELLPEIESYGKEVIAKLDYDYSVTASIGKEWYDTRVYDDFTLPCGVYTSLKITIGEGGGKNWWCVMYPPLCTELASESAPADDGMADYSKSEIRLIQGGKYNVKFKLLEILSSAFTKNS